MSASNRDFYVFQVLALYGGDIIEVPFLWGLTGEDAETEQAYTPFVSDELDPARYQVRFYPIVQYNGHPIYLRSEPSASVILPYRNDIPLMMATYEDTPDDDGYTPPSDIPPEEGEEEEPEAVIPVTGAAVTVPAEEVGLASIWSTINDNLVTFFTSGANLLGDVSEFVTGIGQSVAGSIFGFLGNLTESLTQPIQSVGVSAMDEMITATSEHSPDPELLAKATQLVQQLQEKQSKIVGSIHQSPADPDAAPEASNGLATGLLVAALSVETAGALLDLIHPIKNINATEISQRIVDALGSHEVIARVMNMPTEKGLLIPLEHHFNELYQPNIPNYSDLIEAVVKEVISLEDFTKNMKYLGYSEEWARVIWDKHFTAPDFTAILNAYYRGIVSKEQLDQLQILVDLDPRYKEIWDGLIEQIPPYSELVNQLVKEVISQDEFTYYMKWYGFDEKWSSRIWDAHFTSPALGDLLTAWRRGLIDEARLDELMILVDLDPRYKEIFDTRKYNEPTIREARYMFELKAIDEATVRRIVELSGLLPEYIDPMVEYLTKFQERSEITGYLTALETAYTHGTITEAELRAATRDAGYTDEVADWKIKTAEVRKTYLGGVAGTVKEKLLSLSDLKAAYNYAVIGEDEFRTKLLLLGYELGEVDLLIRLEEEKRTQTEAGGRKEALTQAELVNAWRYGEVTEDYLRMQLMLRGLPESEINILINTKKAQWGVES